MITKQDERKVRCSLCGGFVPVSKADRFLGHNSSSEEWHCHKCIVSVFSSKKAKQ